MTGMEALLLGLDPLAVFISAACSVFVVAARRNKSVERLLHRDLMQVQDIHDAPTSRLGGIGVIAALAFGAIGLYASGDVQSSYWLFLLSLVPVTVAGVWEDITGRVSAKWRLAAAAASGVLFVAIFGQWINRSGIPFVDGFLDAWPWIAIGFTIFACAGATHAVNLIDGVNGLSGMWAVSTALSLAMITHAAGLDRHTPALLLIASAMVGFLLVNYPMGWIFLGDAGAYAVGHVLSWLAVSILWSASEVAPIAVFLIFLWPVADTIYAIVRRLAKGSDPTKADSAHFHHLAFKILVTRAGLSKRKANPASAAVLAPLYLVPMACGVVFWDNNAVSLALLCVFSAAFVIASLIAARAARAPHDAAVVAE